MQEIELKFLVPESRLKGLMRQARVKSSEVTQLAAHYYDTPDQQLAEAGIGLRIRKEGDAWVQTIKAGGDGIAARLEHNAVLDNEQVQAMLDNNTLMPDLTIYKNTSVAPALAEFKLKKLAKNLTRLYVTDVERTTRLLVDDSGSDGDANNHVEMAYDYGEIIHGNDDTQRDAIQEIEFELISGDIDFLFATAKTWCKRYKLCLSTVTKAERGGLLITEQQHSPAVHADLDQLNIDKKISMPAFVRAAVHNCLLQILPNSSAIVAGSEDDDHVLQLYIGIVRLQAALQAFANYSDEINPDWLPILKQTVMLLNEYRELSHLASHIEPNLQQHGAPTVDWATDMDALKITPKDAISANDFQLTLLELIAFTMSDPSLEPQADQLAIDKLAKTLSKQQAKLGKAVQELQSKKDVGSDNINIESNDLKDDDLQSVDLDDSDLENVESKSDDIENIDLDDNNAEHELHEQLTTLLYISEFATPLLDKKKSKKKKTKKESKRWLKYLAKAQKTLNKYHNHKMYQQRYQLKSKTDSSALYGAGWFAAMLVRDLKRTEKRLAKVTDSSVLR
ncbi:MULTISPECIES: CYTH and CHAD domain-containing protein [unclassified Psychrobacter]|uniref:CYTH and CHAD domain-containing protein n=1 Tax=unclassified Psychrobacter TaxID=196806 RepID=UPI000EBC0C97|nr:MULTISPECIES: CYTH and CHAD domain-containing protein [unclassified Psychrobacter]MBE8609581.1 CYTH and CHAD domain-containing protein [Pseudomonas lundensis]HCI76231.1 inorganic triphosphatase [Psychrobacter sp.]